MDFLIDSVNMTGFPSEPGYSPDRYYSKKPRQETIQSSYCYDLVQEYDLGETESDYIADPFDEHMQEHVENEVREFDLKAVTDWEDEKGPPSSALVAHKAQPSTEHRYSTPSSAAPTATSLLYTLSSTSMLGYIAHKFSEDFLPSTANQIITGVQGTYNEVSQHMDQVQKEEKVVEKQKDEFACDVYDLLPYHAVMDLEELCTTRDAKDGGKKPLFRSLDLANEFVPPIFFESKFELSNPEIYDEVLKTLNNLSGAEETNDDAQSKSADGDKDVAYKKGSHSTFDWEQFHSPLHLFWDYSETALREQVKFRSGDYFMENASSRELEILIAHGQAEINAIQHEMNALRSSFVDEPQQVPKMAKQRQNLQLTMSVLNKATELMRQKRKINRLLRKNEPRKALSLISSLQKDIQSTHVCHVTKQAFTLNEFAPIQAYSTKLNELGDEAAASLVTFIIQRFIEWPSVNKPDPKDDSTADTLESPETEDELLEKLGYLKSIGKMALVNETYTERLGDLMYVTVKTVLTECAADAVDAENQEDPSRETAPDASVASNDTTPAFMEAEDISVAQGLANMNFESFMKCVSIVLREILEVMSVAVTVNRFLNQEGFPLVVPEKVGSRKADTLALHAASDLAESLLTGLFEMRSSSLSATSLDELTQLYQACSNHAVTVGELVGRRQNSILQCLSRTVRSFIDAKHVANLSQIETALDDERWTPCELSHERKLMLVRISQEGTEDPLDSNLDELCSTVSRNKVVASLFTLLQTMQWNISCASSYQEFTATLVRKSADLMRSFNNRTLQLVVNGGATRSSARLKSIKLKHLAMALNCVDLMMIVVPNIRAQLSSMTAGRASSEGMKNMSKIAFSEFDGVVHEIEKHTDQIIERVVAVMRDLLQHSRSVHLAECDFDAKASELTGEGEVAKICPFFEDIVSHMCTTHRIFRDVVSEHLLKRLCSRLFSYIDQELPVILVMAATTPSARLSHSNSKGVEATKSIAAKDLKAPLARQAPLRSHSSPTPAIGAAKKEQAQFSLPKSRGGKKQMVVELIWLTAKLNQLKGVMPHSFTMANVLGRKLGIVKREKKSNDLTRRQNSSSSGRSASVNGSRSSPNLDSDGHTVASSASSTGLSMESMPMELLTSLTAAISGAAASIGSDVESLSAPTSEASYSSEVESVASELSQLFLGIDAGEL